MKGKKLNLAGQRFERLIVLSEYSDHPSGRTHWNCLCDCGKEKAVARNELRSGECKSCGCLSIDKVRERRFKHGASKTKEYRTWTNIRDRCHNPHHAHYNRYGGRGIKVCDQWNCSDNGFEKFFSHMGKAPSENLTIERVDNDGDYCPENCIWATQAVQAMNRNVSLKFEWNGKIMTLPQIAHAEGKCPKHVYRLVKINKKSIELAVQKAKAA